MSSGFKKTVILNLQENGVVYSNNTYIKMQKQEVSRIFEGLRFYANKFPKDKEALLERISLMEDNIYNKEEFKKNLELFVGEVKEKVAFFGTYYQGLVNIYKAVEFTED